MHQAKQPLPNSDKNRRLIWLDLEMTGLDLSKDVIIEIATIVTDYDLNVVAVGPNLAISHPESILNTMDNWNKNTHTGSGLISRIQKSDITMKQAEEQTLDFLRREVAYRSSPMCGSTICTDRRFLAVHMPNLEQFFHYRQVDASSLKVLTQCWYPNELSHHKNTTHTALQDVYDSINELKYYRSAFFVPEKDGRIDDNSGFGSDFDID